MGFYRWLGRPAMFALPPETAHSVAARALALPLPWSWIAGAPASVPTHFEGVDMANPVGLAAGFDKSGRMVEGLAALGFGYLVIGTVSRHPREGNPKPRIVRLKADRALLNAMGIPNDGAERVAARLATRRTRTPVFASIADEELEDVAAVHELLSPVVDGFELNVSSPNSPWRHSGRDNAAHLATVLAAIADGERPLSVKVPPFDPQDGVAKAEVLELIRIAVDHGVRGLTCANTRPVAAASLPRGRGGLSGGPLTAATPRMVEIVAGAAPGVSIHACGGIFTATDAKRCLEAGATTLQAYTSFIYEGPRLVQRISHGLRLEGGGPR